MPLRLLRNCLLHSQSCASTSCCLASLFDPSAPLLPSLSEEMLFSVCSWGSAPPLHHCHSLSRLPVMILVMFYNSFTPLAVGFAHQSWLGMYMILPHSCTHNRQQFTGCMKVHSKVQLCTCGDSLRLTPNIQYILLCSWGSLRLAPSI